MTHRNPFFSLRWHDLRPRLLLADVDEIVERLRVHFPELVLFPRCLHHSPTPRDDRYENVPIRFWQSPSHFLEDPWLKDGLSPNGLILRVPWPEDLRSGDPERLIGGRTRRIYDAGPKEFRRYGRVLYLGSGISDEIATVDRAAIADFMNISLSEVPEIRYFRYHMSQSSLGFLYNADDPEMVAFEKLARSCMNGLATTTAASYDILTGEPVYAFKVISESKRLQRRCALEDGLYVGPGSNVNGRVLFMGPAPALTKRWREEAGLPYKFATQPSSVKKMTRLDFSERQRQGIGGRLPKSIDPGY